MAASPKLTVELVPQTAWWKNVRSELPRKEWDRLRKATYKAAGNHCEACGGVGRRHTVECHEIWDYDDEALVQTLKGLVALCPPCHEVKHFGFAQARGRGDIALAHLQKVNGWDEVMAEVYVQDAFQTWLRRSESPWVVNLDWLTL